ncbi:hypothetical protein WOLCODRAFT_158062 [Wolfiporia cocos MD-104 SS10]|uniref:Uncharacterized protein n=1 Tax=Wolfiporia cocos (strain MD-104) TaxID=742152 RepID=A0A2H3J6R0_WOLCO|nr:hypothetical protein WOLCODRAFT_158062 [Wolfiporia cocos MD-104 SS10]
MPKAATFTVAPRNAATGEREEWDIRPSQSLEDRISDAVSAPKRGKKSRQGNKPYHKKVVDPEEVRRVNHEAAVEDIRRKKLQKLLCQREKLEARIKQQSLDELIAQAAAERVAKERNAKTLAERLAPPKKSLMERVEELRIPAEWITQRGIPNPKHVACTEKKWDWYLQIDKKMDAAHPKLSKLWKSNDYTTTAPIIEKFTKIVVDFDDLSKNLEERVRQDSIRNEELRLLEKYLKRVQGIFGDLEIPKHVTYLKQQIVYSKVDFDLGKPKL